MNQNTEESYLDFRRRNLDFHKDPDSVAIFSGGLDSTTLVYDMLAKGMTPHLISFNYGQRHSKELTYAMRTAQRLCLRHDIVDLTGLTHLISNSALTQGGLDDSDENGIKPVIEVPEGHYAEDNMKKTVVPNRNMIMLSIAAGIAVNNNYKHLATGVHAGDHFVYPDCRPQFIQIMDAAIVAGNEGFGPFEDKAVMDAAIRSFIYAPFLNASKADIAFRAMRLDVPLHETWSCYKGGEKHCGKCGTCVERMEAIAEAQSRLTNEDITRGVGLDETEYEDYDFWRQVVSDRS